MVYHRPVLLEECIEGLRIKPSGVYVDTTFGGGGHSKAIIDRLDDNGHLFAFDQDEDAIHNIWEDPKLTFIHANSRYLRRFMDYYNVTAIDGLLADLGVSSWQFDNAERGFSFREDHLLDMRMNRRMANTAADIIMKYPGEELLRVFSDYGQVRNAKTLVRALLTARESIRIQTIGEFLDVVDPLVRGNRARYLAQVFQALRIELNDEINALADLLAQATELLAPDARLVVISYHSVEDALVKRWMKTGNAEGEMIKDDSGRRIVKLKMLTKKPVVPGEIEIKENSRARSAKMRIAEKVK